MLFWHKTLCVVFTAALLVACSAGRKAAEFTLDGYQEPPAVCPINPQSFAQATPIPDFEEGNGCGMKQAYRVMAVNGVGFSQPAQITCSVADTLKDWLDSSVQPAAQAVYGQRVVSLRVIASYSCRARDNIRGARLSEHGRGNAIDIAAFTLADGHEIVVLTGYYGNVRDQRFLRTVRAQACGPFHTVLGPGSDPYHRNHIHLDMQVERRSGGPYCH